ncbi:MAG: hypothetical protein FJX23_10140 [Alphaproteobacteria bacterium]|nr:hypothetical protein [Alphaproteobacteria bacterium]
MFPEKGGQEYQELKRGVRYNLFQSLNSLSDIELQQRWLDSRLTCPVWTYVEFMESYFDMSEHNEWWLQQGILSDLEYQCIKEFDKLLKNYKEPNGDVWNYTAILNDPAWQEIVAIGKEATKKLKAMLTDVNDLKAFEPIKLNAGDYTWPKEPTLAQRIRFKVKLFP